MNTLFALLGIESWKPLLTALVLPPVPLLVLVLLGAGWLPSRRGRGWTLVGASVVLLWLFACTGTAELMSRTLLQPPPALSGARIDALKAQSKSTAIVVLGAGAEPFAPEYGGASLRRASLERLRYGVWLSRASGAPLAFSGGVGWGEPDGPPEAQIAARIAAGEFGRPLKWVEDQARDTHANAALSVALLRAAGIQRIVVVTHAWHMPRALRDFEDAARGRIRIEAAPIGLARHGGPPWRDWMPSSEGTTRVRQVLRELLGRAMGA